VSSSQLPEDLSKVAGPKGPLFFKGLSMLREDSVLAAVREISEKRGLIVYLVGGMLRDIFLNETLPHDYDFVCETEAEELAQEAARCLGGSAFILDKKNGLYRVVSKGEGRTITLDFLPLRSSSIEENLCERDFTMNAMALSLDSIFDEDKGVLLIDPLGGLSDCELKILRHASKKALETDPLRSLRGVRLSQRYGLHIDKDTRVLIRQKALLIAKKPVSKERVRDELALIFTTQGTAEALAELRELALYNVIFPSLNLKPMADTFKTLKECEALIIEIQAASFPSYPLEMRACLEADKGGGSVALTLKLAAFFYDIFSLTVRDYAVKIPLGEEVFFRERVQIEVILKGLLFGNKLTKTIVGALGALDRFFHIPLSVCTRPAVMALFFDKVKRHSLAAAPVFFCLVMADIRRSGAPLSGGRYGALLTMTEFYFSTYLPRTPEPFFTGEEIISTFGVREGERVGLVKLMIEEALFNGLVSDRADVVPYIKSKISERWG